MNSGTFLLLSVSLGKLWSRPFCALALVDPAYPRYMGTSVVPQGRCLWKHKHFTCKVLQIMCSLEQNKLSCLKSRLSEFYCSTSEAIPTITQHESAVGVVSWCTHSQQADRGVGVKPFLAVSVILLKDMRSRCEKSVFTFPETCV